MAITYTWGSPTVRPRTEEEKTPGGAKGLVPKDKIYEIIDTQLQTCDLTIEVRQGAYTAEEWDTNTVRLEGDETAKTRLTPADYGKKWRAWYGDPLPEQMAAEPWDEPLEGGEG